MMLKNYERIMGQDVKTSIQQRFPDFSLFEKKLKVILLCEARSLPCPKKVHYLIENLEEIFDWRLIRILEILLCNKIISSHGASAMRPIQRNPSNQATCLLVKSYVE